MPANTCCARTPPSLNGAGQQAIVEARDRSGKRVTEAFMVRYHPQWRRIRELVRAGRIGTVGAIQSAFLFTMLDPKNVRNRADIGGGALYDVGCYPIVTARYVFGAEPERAIALIDRDPVFGVDRLSSGLLGFPGGGQLAFSSALQLANYQRVAILGTQGRIEVEVPFTPQKDHACRIAIASAKNPGGALVFEDFAPVDQYALQCDLSVAVFRGEAAQEFPIEDAIANMRVIDALYRSAGLGPLGIPVGQQRRVQPARHGSHAAPSASPPGATGLAATPRRRVHRGAVAAPRWRRPRRGNCERKNCVRARMPCHPRCGPCSSAAPPSKPTARRPWPSRH